MRSLIQDKQNEDHVNGVKTKEKTTALFNEVVRIGEEQEKNSDVISQLQMNLETRL